MTATFDDLTEFVWIDPEEVHLVKTPANGVHIPLLAKAAADALGEEDAFSGDGMVKYVSAEARRKYAKSGVAMPNGDFPIPDEGHLRSAIGRLAEYKGDKAAAKAHIIKRAKALGLTHLLPKDWNVAKDAIKQTAPDKSVPEDEALNQTREVDEDPGPAEDPSADDGGTPRDVTFPHGPSGDGQGDTAPAKDMHLDTAESQTRDDVEGNACKADVDMTGSKPPHADADMAEGKREGEAETEEVGKETPGSSEWEHKDVALGEKAERLVSQLADVVRTFTEREKAEGGASKQARRILSAVKYLSHNEHLLKEYAQMTDTNELVKALDELGKARRAEKKAEAKKAAKKEAKKAAKAAAEGAPAPKAADDVKALKKSKLAERLQKAEALLEKVASEDGRRPFVNGAGVAAVLRGPGAESAFKVLEDRVSDAEERLAKAVGDTAERHASAEVREAKRQLSVAKMIVAENARTNDVAAMSRSAHGIGNPLFGTVRTHGLGDDPQISGV